jgi:hypothetical protein
MKILKWEKFLEGDLFTGSGIEGYDSNKIGLSAKTIFCKKVSDLKSWIYKPYGLDLQSAIGKILSKFSTNIDFNKDPKYQIPLEYLKKTGRFDNKDDYRYIQILPNGTYYAECLNNFSQVLDSNGDYDPVNKLNTNYYDLAELVFDILSKEDPNLVLSSLKLSEFEFKKRLSIFFKGKNLVSLINKNIPDIKVYISHNRKMSDIGNLIENFVKDRFLSIGKNGVKLYECLYQGGDGDPIDMVYGVDLIIKKINGDDFKLIQVKSSSSAVRLSSFELRYSDVDLFCSKIGNKVICYTKNAETEKIF